jgi:hypothetical protein
MLDSLYYVERILKNRGIVPAAIQFKYVLITPELMYYQIAAYNELLFLPKTYYLPYGARIYSDYNGLYIDQDPYLEDTIEDFTGLVSLEFTFAMPNSCHVPFIQVLL